jgi:hypothetical protein
MDKLLELLAQLLVYLQGKKSTIIAIAGALNTYAMAVGLIDNQLGALIATVIVILGGGANVVSMKMGNRMAKYQ